MKPVSDFQLFSLPVAELFLVIGTYFANGCLDIISFADCLSSAICVLHRNIPVKELIHISAFINTICSTILIFRVIDTASIENCKIGRIDFYNDNKQNSDIFTVYYCSSQIHFQMYPPRHSWNKFIAPNSTYVGQL